MFTGGCRSGGGEKPEVFVAAAMSLRQVMPALFEAHREGRDLVLSASYGASGDLRKQIEGGAPVDVAVFADAATVDGLIEGGHAEREGRAVVATNDLVLIGRKNAGPVTFRTLDSLPDGAKIAIGDPGAVPAGRYAKRALEALGKWEAVRDRLVFAGHVGAVLNYARRGEVAAGVVYGTELHGVDDVLVLDRAEGDWAPRAEVVAAFVGAGKAAEAGRGFLAFLSSERARAIFREYGFGMP
ncbi:MAG: molybdate ABC transporter substrate-binding protein [Candidatus Binatia bacterium]